MNDQAQPAPNPASPYPIELTPRAAEEVLRIRAAENIPATQVLRARVLGGGCSGFTYDLYFDEPKPDIDFVFELDGAETSVYVLHGVQMVVDQMSVAYLHGTTIDFVDGLKGKGFTFNNPQVKSTCGCGSSFST